MQGRPLPRRLRAGWLAIAILAGGLLAACAIRPPGGPAAMASPTATAAASASTSGSPGARPFRPTPAPAPTFAMYTVRRGDTLIGLAARFGTTPESLSYWNRARYPSLDPDSTAYRPERIEVGWELAYLPGEVVDPENLPPASAAPTDGSEAIQPLGPFPTLPADGGAALVRRGPAGLGAVALTFEYAGGAGAGPGGAAAVVAWLAANAVPATVFVAPGASAGGDAAGGAVLDLIRSSPTVRAGLLAGLGTGSGAGPALAAADAALATRVGRTTAPWLRPADGRASTAALAAAGRAGWRWVVTWDVDPGDGVAPAAGGPIATDIVTRVAARATGGSIVRLQLGGSRTVEALPGIVDALASAGLRVAPLAEVLGLPSGE